MKRIAFGIVPISLLAAANLAFAAGDTAKGGEIYNTICIACHGPDPSIDGPIGPAIKGASLELLEARVLHAKYPEGYKPKRDTTMMPPFPQYKDNIEDLGAFLK